MIPKAFTYLIRPELIIPLKPQKHISYKKNNRQVSFDISNNKIYIYEKGK